MENKKKLNESIIKTHQEYVLVNIATVKCSKCRKEYKFTTTELEEETHWYKMNLNHDVPYWLHNLTNTFSSFQNGSWECCHHTCPSWPGSE